MSTLQIPKERVVIPTDKQVYWLRRTRGVKISLDPNLLDSGTTYVNCEKFPYRAFWGEVSGGIRAYWFRGQLPTNLGLVLTSDFLDLPRSSIIMPKRLEDEFGDEVEKPSNLKYIEISLEGKHKRFGRQIRTRQIY